MLTALSLGVGVGTGCFRTAAFGLFAGGAGGLGLPCLVVEVPLGGYPLMDVELDADTGWGTGRAATGGGGGGAAVAALR